MILILEFLPYNTNFKCGSHYYLDFFVEQFNFNILWIEKSNSFFHSLKNLPDQIKNKSNNIEGKKIKKKVVKITNRLSTYTPSPFFPYTDKLFFRNILLNKFGLKKDTKFLESLIKEKIEFVWVANPFLLPLLENISYDFLLYRISDNLTAFPGIPKTAKYFENETCKKANAIFCSTKNLTSKFSNMFPEKTYYLPNGFDNKLFNKTYPKPVEYSNNKPRIIYLGAVEKWFDYNLFSFLIDSLPQVDFFLIGNHSKKLNNLKKKDNFFHLGQKAQQNKIPFLQHASVGIIPFEYNKLTNDINPIKLYEYLAAGIPVVSTPMEEINNLQLPLATARNKVEFLQAIKQFLNNPVKINDCKESVEDFTWEKRFTEILEITQTFK